MKGKYKMPHPNTQYEYYHFVSNQSGDRYFKVDRLNNKVYQVVLSSGLAKKGRPHCIGLYHIAMSSFLGTYYHYLGREKQLEKWGNKTRLKITTEIQYEKAKQQIILTF